MNDKKSISSNAIFLAVSGLVIVLLIVLNVININNISNKSSLINSELAMLENKKSELNELEKLSLIRPELEKAFALLSTQIPDEPSEDEIIEYISSLSAAYKNDLIQIRFDDRVANGVLTEMPLSLTFKGSYSSFVAFIDALSEGQRLFRIDEINMDKTEGADGKINASVTARAFYK